MRIKEVRVHRYGPLSDFVLSEPGQFTLLFGPNESGKTLLLDAILRLTLRRERDQALFWDRDRVDHEPDGFVELVHADQSLRFPDDGSLPDVLDIHAEDLRNILVVRASDLHVQEGQQGDYYAGLTDRLMGIHREPMREITEKLLDIGRLTTARRELSDSAEYGSIASRFEKAKSLLEGIAGIEYEFGAKDLNKLEREQIEAEEKLNEIQNELGLLEEAEKRERYHDGQQLLNDLQGCVEELEELPNITQDDYDQWRDAEGEIQRASEEISEARAELDQLEKKLADAKGEEESARDHLRQLEGKQESVQDLGDEARIYRRSLEEEAGRAPLFKMAPQVLTGASVLFVVASVAMALAPDALLSRIMGVVAIVALVGSVGLWIWAKRREGLQYRKWEELRLNAAQLGIQVDSAEPVLQIVRQFSDDLNRAKEKQNVATNHRERVEGEIISKEEAIEQKGQEIELAQETLGNLKDEFGVKTLDDLKATWDRAEGVEGAREKLETKLEERFGEASGSIETKKSAWRKRVEALAEFEDAAESVEYDQTRISELEAQQGDLGQMIEETGSELESARSQIDSLAQQANEVLRPVQLLPGDTLEDLNALERRLKEFVDDTQERASLTRRAIEILESIQAEEEQKVKDLFGEDDLSSQYFRSITDDAYHNVDYDPESGELLVVRASAEVLSAYKLSSGTYDQLYLATRLSLAERLLGGEPGFLLLDDPFLTSDASRLDRQIEILLDLAENGWQIVYFSVKDEIKSLVGEVQQQPGVSITELEPLFEV